MAILRHNFSPTGQLLTSMSLYDRLAGRYEYISPALCTACRLCVGHHDYVLWIRLHLGWTKQRKQSNNLGAQTAHQIRAMGAETHVSSHRKLLPLSRERMRAK